MYKKKIFVTGHKGLVGSSIVRILNKNNKYRILTREREKLDLLNQNEVKKFFRNNKPDIVIHAAGKVGGILHNSTYPAEFIFQNSQMALNIINCSYSYKIKKLINLGSACIYPKFAKQPIKESYLLDGKLESSNEAYAIAKILSLKMTEYYKKQYKSNFISLQPTNLYGTNDNFNIKSGHVIPALINKFHEAKIKNSKSVEVWGSGKAKREFLFVDDLANAIFHILKLHDKKLLNISKGFPIFNVGSGEEISIKDLSNKIKKICKFDGKIFFDKNFPDGTYRKNLDSTKIKKTGWKPIIKLNQGLNKVLKNYKYKNK